MITDPIELATQRGLTESFIAADFETITLIPRLRQRTTTGGITWAEQPARVPQRFKVSEVVSRAATDNRVPGGEMSEAEYMLIGSWNAEVGSKDIFTMHGDQWEVLTIEPDNGYEKRASVRRYGG